MPVLCVLLGMQFRGGPLFCVLPGMPERPNITACVLITLMGRLTFLPGQFFRT